MDSRQLHEVLDACRPGSDDLAQPDMAAARAELERSASARRYASRVEAFDRNVAAALHDVAVPDGLRERLLAKLAESAKTSEPAVVSVAASEIPSVHAAGGWRRRNVLATIVGALAALAACTLVAFWLRSSDENWGPALVAESAAANFEEYAFRSKTPQSGAVQAYPPSRFLLIGRQPLRMNVGDIAGCSGVAYQLKSGRGVAGVLFVLNPGGALQGFPARPPATPQVDTGGLVAASWAEQGRVYVLVFRGGAEDYPGFLRQGGQLTLGRSTRFLSPSSLLL